MKYLRYHDTRNHDETCVFEEWDKDNGELKPCGKKAVGQQHLDKKSGAPLCDEHFDYATKLQIGEIINELPARK